MELDHRQPQRLSFDAIPAGSLWTRVKRRLAPAALLLVAAVLLAGRAADTPADPSRLAQRLFQLQHYTFAALHEARFAARSSLQMQWERLAQTHYLAHLIRVSNPTVDADQLAAAIVAESRAAQYDPFLVTAVILAESRFHSAALSEAGARGLMQLRPSTASWLCSVINTSWLGERELHTPGYNIRLGIAYLKHLGRLYGGDIDRVLAAYNWGPGNLDRALAGDALNVPAVTSAYTRKVTRYYRQWKEEFEPLRAQLFGNPPGTMRG